MRTNVILNQNDASSVCVELINREKRDAIIISRSAMMSAYNQRVTRIKISMAYICTYTFIYFRFALRSAGITIIFRIKCILCVTRLFVIIIKINKKKSMDMTANY